ncbi:MAG: hypothetical protein COA44_00610 [Arcobacter sp.]|nr:MAG: hypothetical protein COA44_00610 [Arcobacter sp.]
MKIGIIFTLTQYGGVQTCVISLIKGLNARGIRPTIIWVDEPNPNIIKENNLNVNFEKYYFPFSTAFIAKQKASIRYLIWPFNMVKFSKLKQKYDFIYTFRHNYLQDDDTPYAFYLSGPPFLPQLNPQKGAKKYRFLLFKAIYKLFIKPFYPIYEFSGNTKNTVINAKFTSDLFYEAHDKRLEVVYPSNAFEINTDKGFSNKSGIVFLSRIVPYKRPEMLIELAKKYPDEVFSILGTVESNQEPYYQSLKDLVEKYKLNNVKFVINEKFDVLQKALKDAKIYVFPAVNEHFGITTVEAIMSGTIPFVHNSGGQKEIVDKEELRFNDDEFFDKFDELITASEEKMLKYQEYFYERTKLFSEKTYNKRMLKYIDE